MAELNVQQKNIVNQLRQAYPELKNYSDEQILSLYNQQLNNIQLPEDKRISIMNGKNGVVNDGMGIQLETSQKAVSKEQESQLKSALTARLNAVSTNVKKAEDSNGFLGKAWSWAKNTFNFGDSSNKVREQLKADLKALESGNIAEAFKKITGLDYTVENVNKFLNNEVQTKSETALNGYTEGQDMASDITADIISGIAAVGIYTAAVAAAPFTGGASIAVGVVAAGASAAAIKTGIKYADAKSGSREYTTDNLKKDLATGAFSGVLAPITGGIGGAVGKTIAVKTFGIQAFKQVGKEVAEEAVEQTAKSFVKTALTNPYGYEYIGGNVLKRAGAYSAEMITDGAVSGFFDSAFRTAYDGGSLEDVGEAAVMGGVSGGAGAWFLGGSIKVFGRGMQKVFGKNNVQIDAQGNRVRVIYDKDLIDLIGKDLFNKNKELFKDSQNRMLIYSMYKNTPNIQNFHFNEMKNILQYRFNNKNFKNLLYVLYENGSKTEDLFNLVRFLENEYPTSEILNKKIEYINDDLINSILNLKKTVKNDETLFTFIKLKLDTDNVNSYEILQNYNGRYHRLFENLEKTNSKELFNEIYTLIKDVEYNNQAINKNEIIKIFSMMNFENLKSRGDNELFLQSDINLFQTYIELFKTIPQKNNEKLSDYFQRIDELRISNKKKLLSMNAENRLKQNQVIIESNYTKDDINVDKIELTKEEAIEFDREKDYYIFEAGNSSTSPGMGNSNYSLKDKLLAKGLETYERYNSTEYFSKHSDKSPYLGTEIYKFPPVIRFLSPRSVGSLYKTTSGIVNSFPEIGETYQAKALKCCFTTPIKGNENLIFPDVIVEIHPKSETSKAHYIEGWGNEVRYGGNIHFIVIDKYCEIVERDIGAGYKREVKGHVILQEL